MSQENNPNSYVDAIKYILLPAYNDQDSNPLDFDGKVRQVSSKLNPMQLIDVAINLKCPKLAMKLTLSISSHLREVDPDVDVSELSDRYFSCLWAVDTGIQFFPGYLMVKNELKRQKRLT